MSFFYFDEMRAIFQSSKTFLISTWKRDPNGIHRPNVGLNWSNFECHLHTKHTTLRNSLTL